MDDKNPLDELDKNAISGPMSVSVTLWILMPVIALIGFSIWRDSKPRQNGKIYWFSWKPVMMISVVVAIVLITHLVNVFGVETGQGRPRF
jgi:hypothetical protein